MNNKTLTKVVIAGGVLILLLLTAILFIPKPDSGDNGPVACTMEAKLCPDGSYVGRTGPKCEFAACPATSSKPLVSASGNMKVYSPIPNQTVTRPLTILGEGRTFENAFSFRLLDAQNKVLAEGHDMLNAPDIGQFGPFSVSLNYPQSAGNQQATLEVFEYSAKDGSVVNNVRVPVTLSQTEGTSLKTYFSNTKADPNLSDCARVFVVNRVVPKTTSVAKAALEQLLAGVTDSERALGYTTSIPSNVRLNSITITNEVARADFSAELNEGVAGSCRVSAIRAQIEQTLYQFSTVKSVIISVDGRSEDILQP